MRQFEVDREHLNLAKRIMQCESEHSRNRYAREWKKTKKFMRVRSNFKPQLSAEEPKIVKFEGMPGHGRLAVRLELRELSSVMKLINPHSLYLLKFCLGRTPIIANRDYLTLDTAHGYSCAFMAPSFLRDKPISVKLVKVVENEYYEAGRFCLDLGAGEEQSVTIMSKSGKQCGQVSLHLETEMLRRRVYEDSKAVNEKSFEGNKENEVI